MCQNRLCPCRWPDNEIIDVFMTVWDMSWTAQEEAYLDTEPDIAGPLRELDRRQRAEKNDRRRKQWGSD
jgi:hypothetical protein